MRRWKLPPSFWILQVAAIALSASPALVRHSGWSSWCPVVALAICALVMPDATVRVCQRIQNGFRWLVRKLREFVIAVGYFGVFVPISLVLRLMGRRSAANSESLWINRRDSQSGGQVS